MKIEQFNPARCLKHRHLQTLYPAIFKNHIQFDTEIETFELEDGDFLECIWHKKPTKTSKKPIVILFHGLAGGFNSPYIQRVMPTLATRGFSIVLMHFRGCGTKQNRLPRSYHSGDTKDAKDWIDEVIKRYPSSPIFTIGYSLGGNMLLKLLAELSYDSPIKAAISISAPMDLKICADQMNQGFSKIYQYYLIRSLKKDLLKKYKIHDMRSIIGIDENSVKKINSFWEFDDLYTAPIHGFKDACEYYKLSSAKPYLKHIKTDTLIIHAIDDPFMTPKVIPNIDELSKSIKLETYSNGGHVGFISGNIIKPQYWLENRIVRYFDTIISKESP